MRSRRDLVVSSRRLVGEICNISEISGEILTRSRRDSREMKDISARQTRSRRYERDFCEINEISPRTQWDEIATRSRRDERHLGEIKEISPRTLRDFARSRWDLVEPKALFTWRWGTPGRWGNPLRWGNPPVHIISHFNVITFTC